jgi:hypothetical protein
MNPLRKFENFHILLWLLKDLSWLMNWKFFGSFMIIPTFGFAVFITFKNRKDILELLPNVAVLFWICANSTWMLSEFFLPLESIKTFAVFPFIGGIVMMLLYAFLLTTSKPEKF